MGLSLGLGFSSKKEKSTQDTTSNATTNSASSFDRQATAPDWATQGLQGLSEMLQGLGGRDAASFVAGPSALQQDQFSLANFMGGQSAGNLDAAGVAIRGAAGYQPQQVTAGQVAGQAVDPTQAFGSLGAADPTQGLASALSGNPDNPYLAAMNQANINQGLQGYNDALGSAANTLTRSVLPSVRSGANLAGGYGGTRQGLAEGVAIGDFGTQLGRNARDLAQSSMDSGNLLYGGAYENAQNRQAQAALSLAGMGLDNAQANASRDLAAQQSNQSAGLQAGLANQSAGLQGAGLNLNAGQGLQNLGLAGYDAVTGAGATQQGLNQAQAQAPLDLAGWLNQNWSSLPFNLVTGESGSETGTQTENATSSMKGTGKQSGFSASASFSPK